MNTANHKNPGNIDRDRQTSLPLEEALGNFRRGMRAWSEHELTRRPAQPLPQPARPHWHWLTAPVIGWAAAAAFAITAVGVPLGVRHHNAVLAGEQHLALVHRQQLEQEQADQLAANKAADDQLLQHVDSDIAQDTPDALQPLASLMSSSGAE